MSRGFLLSFIALGALLASLLAAFPLWDLEVAQLFFDPKRAKFPLSVNHEWNLVRQVANAQAGLSRPEDAGRAFGSALSARLIPARARVTSNLLLKENWGRPRPNGIRQFAGTADFQP